MRKKIIICCFLLVGYLSNAQLKLPQASPRANVSQLVGFTNVEINYSRPSARGRDVFNNLVPFGKLWRTGANENTTISFSDDVVIDGKTLPKGKYSLYTNPRADNWEVYFYATTDNWGNPQNWDESKIVLKTTVVSEHVERFTESFTISITNLDSNFAKLELSWENTIVALKFDVPTQKKANDSIEKVLAGPTAGDYFSAAQYLYQSNGDAEKALTYVEKALVLNQEKPYFYYRLKSLIQAKKGDKPAAIETAKLSLTGAETANNQDYIKMNKESIAEWSK